MGGPGTKRIYNLNKLYQTYEPYGKGGGWKGSWDGSAWQGGRSFNYMGNGTPSEPVCRIRGCPFDTQPDDVAEALCDFGVQSSDVFMGIYASGPRTGSPNGECFVRFPDIPLLQQAIRVAQGKTICIQKRYLELFPAAEADIEATAAVGGLVGYEENQGKAPPEEEDTRPKDKGGAWARLRGIPFSSDQSAVQKFLTENGAPFVDLDDILIKHGSDGRPSGEAYVEVPTLADAEDIVIKCNRKCMGIRYLEVFLSSYDQAHAVVHNLPSGNAKGWGKGWW